MDNEVDEEDKGGSSEDQTTDEDDLGESLVNGGLEKLLSGLVGVGGLSSPEEDNNGSDKEGNTGAKESLDEGKSMPAEVDGIEDDLGDCEEDS